MKPLVSVVIPTYKREELLDQAIESVCKQTYSNIEIIVVDNSPMSKRIPSVVYIYDKERRGAPHARNIGIEHARGEFIAFLDDDDIWAPEKIEHQVKAMNQDKAIGLTYTDVITINPKGKEIKRSKSSEWGRKTFFKKRYICWSSVVIRKDVLSKIKKNGFYLDENLPSADDFDFLVRASKVTRFKRVPGFLTCYRWHENSISHRFVRSTLLVCRIFIKHHMYLCALREFARHLPESILKQVRVIK